MKAEWTNADALTPSETTGKSVLVIDTPKNCSECKLMYLQGIGEGICNAVDWEERPSWCPLKPMPDIKTEEAIKLSNMINPKSTFQEFADGWNACIKEIEK